MSHAVWLIPLSNVTSEHLCLAFVIHAKARKSRIYQWCYTCSDWFKSYPINNSPDDAFLLVLQAWMDNGFNSLQAPPVFKIICFNINWIAYQSCLPYQVYDFYQPAQVCFFNFKHSQNPVSNITLSPTSLSPGKVRTLFFTQDKWTCPYVGTLWS